MPLLLLAGCDSVSEQLQTRTYDLVYQAEGTFASCTLEYRNSGRTVVEQVDQSLPWEEQISATTNASNKFLATFRATCTQAQAGRITLRVVADGEEIATGTREGTSVSLEIAPSLEVDS